MTKEINCVGCGRTHCTQTVYPDGRHLVQVEETMVMRCLDAAHWKYEILCPDCDAATRVTLRVDAGAPPRRPTLRVSRHGGDGRRSRAGSPQRR
jgi:hypothetical protein